jgi:hypothetical protein
MVNKKTLISSSCIATDGQSASLSCFRAPIKKKPVTGRGGLQGCDMLRVPHCLDNLLIDGGKVVSPSHRPHFTPQKFFFNISGTHFC